MNPPVTSVPPASAPKPPASATRNDSELLRAYGEGSQAAFTAFVERHLGLVYNAALRRTGGDAHRSAEIAQLVFTDAARRAKSLANHRAISGWLFVATRNTALNLARADQRRRTREQTAFTMSQLDNASLDWQQMQPVIDEVLDALSEPDRNAVIARFYEQCSFAEIAAHLRVTESGARMKVDRALEKLRAKLAARGIPSTAAALSAVLVANAAVAAPIGLAASISSVAVASGAASTSAASFLLMNKLQAMVIGAIAVAMLTPPLLQLNARHVRQVELAALRTQTDVGRRDNTELLATLARTQAAGGGQEAEELARLRARATVLRARPAGVLESEMRAPRNLGGATPAATFETLTWALQHGDWETVAPAFNFDVASKAKADEFFAGLPAAVQDQYGTAERFFAHAWTRAAYLASSQNIDAMQVFETRLVDGTAPMEVHAWGRVRAGQERQTVVHFERRGDHWVGDTALSARVLRALLVSLDPATGELRPPAQNASTATK